MDLAMSPFEIGMLVCFGAGWPMSVRKTYLSKTAAGRSFGFLWVVFIGYACGVAHKAIYHPDGVIALYAINGCMVAVDLALCYRYRARERAGERIGAPTEGGDGRV